MKSTAAAPMASKETDWNLIAIYLASDLLYKTTEVLLLFML